MAAYTLDVDDLAGVPEEEYMLPVAELRGSIEFVYSWDPPTPNAEDYWNAVGKRVLRRRCWLHRQTRRHQAGR